MDDKNDEILSQESADIWNKLIDSNFFKDFSVTLEYSNIIMMLE